MIKINLHFLVILSFILLGLNFSINAQKVDQKLHSFKDLSCRKDKANQMLNDETYDVKHYHIDVEISIDTEYIQGSVLIEAVAVEAVSFITLDLDSAYVVNSIDGAADYTFSGDEIVVNFENPLAVGDEFTLKVYYQGVPPLAGGYKGLRYETHNGSEPIIASLSTPYLAHTWWPCNDGTKDKADSVFVDITIDDTMVSGIQMQAISNGILEEVVPMPDNKLKYKWKHNYPIVPYYVMVAISNYQVLEQNYDNGEESFPLIYYVFDSSVSQAEAGVENLPEVMDYFSQIFGPYPFADEKYGMTQLGYYGGIENQTNTIINNMSEGWFMVSVHELAHMWFADMITCSDWHHGWLNEGFASYAEALWIENSQGGVAYQNYMSDFEFYDNGSVYMEDVSNPFTVFQGIIYDKGAYVLHMLRHVLGDEVFFECVQHYASDSQFQYKLATTEDFEQVCETVSGIDLSDFFDQWIYSEYYPKYKYDYYQDEEFNTIIGILQTQENNGWRSVFQMPIDIKFEFVDGTEINEVVQNNEVYQTYDFSFSKEIASVILDPDNWILKNVTEGDFALSIDENPLRESIVVYPNPVQNELIIELKNISLKITKLKVLDAQAVLLESVEVEKELHKTFSYNTSKLTTGIYFLEVQSENKLIRKKFVVE